MFGSGNRRLRVGVLVDLEWRDNAGGHVKCWERIAEAAGRLDLPLDLTVHVQGPDPATIEIAPNVRFVARRPLLSTARWRSFDVGADHTDLAPIHPGLLRDLAHYDVIHTTDAYFAYARTASLAARLWNKALVTSIHTDTPGYTHLYAARILRRWVPGEVLGAWLIDRCRVPQRLARGMERRLAAHTKRADWTLVGAHATDTMAHRTSILRRGIDTTLFSPLKRDRGALEQTLGISPTTQVVLFVGRLDEGKGVRIMTQALSRLIDAGKDVVGIYAGCGKERDWIANALGRRAYLLGQVDRRRLADLYASADVFVLPSEIEISPNVVLEAKASGLPTIVAPNGGGRFVTRDGDDGLVVASRAPDIWAARISEILGDDVRRAAIGDCARADVVRHHPSWERVVAEDLFPIWLRAAAQHKRPAESDVRPAPAYSRSSS